MSSSPQGPRSGRKAKGLGHLRRGEILKVAERLFVAEGYEGATIRKIAEEVGVSSTALYMHFRDKDQILSAICDGVIARLIEMNREIAARPKPAVERMRQMVEAYIRFGLENPNAYSLVFLSARRPSSTVALSEQCHATFVGVVSEVAKEGRLKHGSTLSVSQVIWTACHGFVALKIAAAGHRWAPEAEMIGLILDGIFDGLVSR